MVNINKSTTEPSSLSNFKNQNLGTCTYKDFQNPEKNQYKRDLLIEQNYLCAYCNKRLDEYDSEERLHYLKIEHWYPQGLCKLEPHYNTTNGLDLKHENLLLVCPGRNINPDFLHCDSSRKSNEKLTIKPQDPNYKFENVFGYEGGKIVTQDKIIQEDIDKQLNINNIHMINLRNIALDQFIKNLRSLGKKRIDKKALIKKYSNPNKQNKKHEYCTIILFFIENKLEY